jgi:RNA polymerase sigma-70 factor (ECF subfamily)
VERIEPDLEILSAARSGDEEAGRLLAEEHGASMLRTAWSVLGSYGGSDAEDVVQESFLAALTTDAVPTSDLGGWLRAIAVRKALDAVRSRRRRTELEAESARKAPSTSIPADVLALREALSRLSAPDRAVLVLVDVEGHSMAEAAKVLGTTNVAVRLRAVRARRKLARILRPDEAIR